MYSLELLCQANQVDELSGELWEAGTAGIRETEAEDGRVLLIAGFENEAWGRVLLARFAGHEPRWHEEPETDWAAHAEKAWPARLIGRTFFLCPPWCEEATPAGRHRLVHNPGLACGTGEHPCTQLAMEALEKVVAPGVRVADIGTGSGILAIAGFQLGASRAVGIDPDEDAIGVARENFQLNHLPPLVAAGYADAVASGWADITIANISGTVLLAIMDDLLRITRPGGTLVLTGFTDEELPTLKRLFDSSEVLSFGEWRCLLSRAPDAFVETRQEPATSPNSEE